ncbi:hypothetical protein [Candidatus Vondammii sp. HM_W22]|uniref:hypothetical protein n=1 Tax=Candidatus Vondammii sp. HM_W22 TaxID=2687299 RepID=UPI002E7B9954|nr:hypothetical protein [Candidatus Vondammii sp. HM_W22]
MKNNTLYLPRFIRQKLAEEKAQIRRHTISQLGDFFGSFIPLKVLEVNGSGNFSRHRLFSKKNTFRAFFSQILNADRGCQEIVRKVQAFAAKRSLSIPSAAYLWLLSGPQ